MQLPGPAATGAALARVLERHPYSSSGLIADVPRVTADVQALWSELLGLRGPARTERVIRLTRHEVRLLMHSAVSRLKVEGAVGLLAEVLAAHQPEGSGKLAWLLFLLTEGRQELVSLARPYAGREHAAARLHGMLLDTGAPSTRALRIMREARRGESLEAWLAHPHVALAEYPEFVGALKRRMLEPAEVAETNRREASVNIARWAVEAIPAADLADWYRGFLEATCQGPRWPNNHVVIEAIVAAYKEPTAGSPFWTRVSPGAREAVSLWAMDRHLTELLGEGERVAFWRRFLVEVRGARFNVDKCVVLIAFEGWVAVQFKFTGTATYLLRAKVGLGLSGKDEQAIAKYVRDRRDQPSRGYLGRYEHRGYYWEGEAERQVRLVMRTLADE